MGILSVIASFTSLFSRDRLPDSVLFRIVLPSPSSGRFYRHLPNPRGRLSSVEVWPPRKSRRSSSPSASVTVCPVVVRACCCRVCRLFTAVFNTSARTCCPISCCRRTHVLPDFLSSCCRPRELLFTLLDERVDVLRHLLGFCTSLVNVLLVVEQNHPDFSEGVLVPLCLSSQSGDCR